MTKQSSSVTALSRLRRAAAGWFVLGIGVTTGAFGWWLGDSSLLYAAAGLILLGGIFAGSKEVWPWVN